MSNPLSRALSAPDHPRSSSLSLLAPTLALTLALATSCRPPSGPDDYESQERIPDAAMPIEAPLADGEARLSLGAFYEGPFTDAVLIDDLNAHLYIYEETFSLSSFNGDRAEGLACDRVKHAGGGWWGGGIHWESARDLSDWGLLHLSLKTRVSAFEGVEVAMNNSDSEQAKRSLIEYGFSADGEWHDLEIPLSDFVAEGLDLSRVVAPLVLIGGAGEEGDALLIDSVYLSSRVPSAD